MKLVYVLYIISLPLHILTVSLINVFIDSYVFNDEFKM